MIVRLALVLALGLSGPLTAQEWDRYKPGSLLEIIAQHESEVRSADGPGQPHWALSGEDFPTESRLVYTGEHRPLSPERRELLARWQKAFGIAPAVLELFPNEYRFRAESTDLWLAVQQPLEAPLAEEATAGAPVYLLTTFIGAHYAGGEVTWLFLVNEFDATSP